MFQLIYILLTVIAHCHSFEVICYFGSWSLYRTENVVDLSTYANKCTQIIYSFAKLDEKTNQIQSLDKELDLARNGYYKVTSLRNRNPRLKVLIAIGGWSEGSEKYSKMVANETSRAQFVESVVDFLNLHKFDGLDLDWEHPTQRGGQPEDKVNFGLLCAELSAKLRPQGKLLTAATNGGSWISDQAYDFESLKKSIDIFHVMNYDLHGTWERKAYHHAPLKLSKMDSPDFFTIERSMNYYKGKGIGEYPTFN